MPLHHALCFLAFCALTQPCLAQEAPPDHSKRQQGSRKVTGHARVLVVHGSDPDEDGARPLNLDPKLEHLRAHLKALPWRTYREQARRLSKLADGTRASFELDERRTLLLETRWNPEERRYHCISSLLEKPAGAASTAKPKEILKSRFTIKDGGTLVLAKPQSKGADPDSALFFIVTIQREAFP
jgi:hypothetical protein